jgi:pimeloyl-ACP methyl ester carboxylesterase
MKNKLDLTKKGSGDPVIFLHGLGGDRNQWLNLLTIDLPFQMIFPDMPGHGKNNWIPESGCSFDSFAEEVNKIMDDNPGQRYILAGISMGAGIALRIAYRYPDKIKKALLVRPAWLNNPLPANLDLLYRLGIKWTASNTEDTRKWLLSEKAYLLMRKESEVGANSVDSQLNRPNPGLAARTLTEMISDAPLHKIEDIKSIDVPILIIGTEKDPLHPLYFARQLYNWLPDASFSLIASRYDSPDKHKNELNILLREFLTGS